MVIETPSHPGAEQRMTPWISWLDVKLGGRMLVKYPALSLIGGLTLAVAIGLGAGWFEITRQILEPRLPLDDGERIVRIDTWDAEEGAVEKRSLYDVDLWREQLTGIQELGAFRTIQRNLATPEGDVRPTQMAEITPSAFSLTRVQPLLGRTLVAVDAEPGAPEVVVLGYGIWQSRFQGDRGVLGRTVRLGRTAATVVGVMPEGFGFPVNHQVWVPLKVPAAGPLEGPAITVFGRLAAGASLASAQAELSTVGQRIAATHPATHAQLRPMVAPYGTLRPGGGGPALVRLSNLLAWLILGVAGANVATLMFARTATREAEIVVRNALGASRIRVMLQLLVEALVLCGVAAAVGLLAASYGLDLAVSLFTQHAGEPPFWWRFSIRPATVAYALALAVGGAVLVGLLPAIRATSPRVQRALANMGSGGTSIRFGAVWSVMIVLQVAFAALCLPMAFAAVYFTLHDERSRPAVPTAEVLTFRPELDREELSGARGVAGAAGGEDRAEHRHRLLAIYAELERRLESEGSVAAVTFANGLPGAHYPVRQLEAQREGGQPFLVDANIEGDRVRAAVVAVDFFDAFGMPLVTGRAFNGADTAAGNAVIINEPLARNIGGNALGARVRFATAGSAEAAQPWHEVVGIVASAGMNASDDAVFLPASVAEVDPLALAIRVRGDAAAFAPRLRTMAMEMEPGLRLYEVLSLEEVLRRRKAPEIQGMMAVLAVLLIVMALSSAGLYSLMSVAVTRRTREVGIRLAIGASPRAVISTLFGRAAAQIGIGIVLANALLPPLMTAVGISELRMQEVLPAMLIASAGMLLVGLAACGVPALRALRIQATEAMRYGG